MKNAVYLQRTRIGSNRTIAEIQAELAKCGARRISLTYAAGAVSGINWEMPVLSREVWFSLPVRFTALRAKLKNAKDEDIERIAWRQILAWVKAQSAMIDTGMAKAEEVFMPYACAPGSDKTMFQIWSGQLSLPAGENKHA